MEKKWLQETLGLKRRQQSKKPPHLSSYPSPTHTFNIHTVVILTTITPPIWNPCRLTERQLSTGMQLWVYGSRIRTPGSETLLKYLLTTSITLFKLLLSGLGREMGRRFKREGIYVHLWLIHVEVWQKTIEFCKVNYSSIKKIKMNKLLPSLPLFFHL